MFFIPCVCTILLLLLSQSASLGFKYTRVHRLSGKMRLRATNTWLNRDSEIVFEAKPTNVQESFFDEMFKIEDHDARAAYSISKQSLKDIAHSYQFSLTYLGDFVAQLGCKTPIDVESSIASILTGDQIYSLLQALTSLDPFDANTGYDTCLRDLAVELDVPIEHLINICDKEDIKLPFGQDTTLHSTITDKIRRACEYDPIAITTDDKSSRDS